MDWQSFAKWMEGKLQWQMLMVIISGVAVAIAKIATSSSSSASAKPKYEQLSPLKTRLSKHLYSTAPEKCYCHSCKREIPMTGELAGKHCREIACPFCGSRDVWRRPP